MKLTQAHYKKHAILNIYINLTAKCSHRVYHVISVVDYNLILLQFFITGDVLYSASARLL